MKKLFKKLFLRYKYKNCKIYSNYISSDINMEAKVKIYKNVYIDNNVSIGRYTYVNPESKIYSYTEIGSFCSIGPGVIIGPGEHNYNRLTTHPILYDTNWNRNIKNNLEENNNITVIGNDVWIGCNAIIKKGIKIGNGAVIGAGSVVTKDVPAYAIVVGNPGKIIKYRFEDSIIKELKEIKWWNWSIEEITKKSNEILSLKGKNSKNYEE